MCHSAKVIDCSHFAKGFGSLLKQFHVLFIIFRYQDFEATASASPTKDYLPLGSLLGPSPYRSKDTGSYDDEDYYSESDEIVYCSEENLDIVNRTIKVRLYYQNYF